MRLKGDETATWYVSDDGLLCQKFNKEKCMSIERDGDQYTAFKNGKKKSTFILR